MTPLKTVKAPLEPFDQKGKIMSSVEKLLSTPRKRGYARGNSVGPKADKSDSNCPPRSNSSTPGHGTWSNARRMPSPGVVKGCYYMAVSQKDWKRSNSRT